MFFILQARVVFVGRCLLQEGRKWALVVLKQVVSFPRLKTSSYTLLLHWGYCEDRSDSKDTDVLRGCNKKQSPAWNQHTLPASRSLG